MPAVGSFLVGVEFMLAVALTESLIDPTIPESKQAPFLVPVIEDVVWATMAVAPEGLLLEGRLNDPGF